VDQVVLEVQEDPVAVLQIREVRPHHRGSLHVIGFPTVRPVRVDTVLRATPVACAPAGTTLIAPVTTITQVGEAPAPPVAHQAFARAIPITPIDRVRAEKYMTSVRRMGRHAMSATWSVVMEIILSTRTSSPAAILTVIRLCPCRAPAALPVKVVAADGRAVEALLIAPAARCCAVGFARSSAIPVSTMVLHSIVIHRVERPRVGKNAVIPARREAQETQQTLAVRTPVRATVKTAAPKESVLPVVKMSFTPPVAAVAPVFASAKAAQSFVLHRGRPVHSVRVVVRGVVRRALHLRSALGNVPISTVVLIRAVQKLSMEAGVSTAEASAIRDKHVKPRRVAWMEEERLSNPQ
jgi:hypothetical protein